jgi:hypothetical protein
MYQCLTNNRANVRNINSNPVIPYLVFVFSFKPIFVSLKVLLLRI